jgi:hypothetical protein
MALFFSGTGLGYGLKQTLCFLSIYLALFEQL